MVKKLTSIEVYFMVKELQELTESKIDQVYANDDEVLFSLHKQEFGKKFLRIKNEILYITKEKSVQNETPSNFCTILRKNIVNWRIKSITQIESERILDIELYFKDQRFHVIVELFGGGNVILLKNDVIVIAKTQKTYTSRKIAPKEKYEYPKQNYNFLKIDRDVLKKILNESEKENIVKTIAMDLFLGGLYAEELLTIAKIDKSANAKDVDSDIIYDALQILLSSSLKPNKIAEYIVPIKLKSVQGEVKEYVSFSDALLENESESKKIDQKESTHTIFDKKIQKLSAIINLQKLQIEKLKKESDQKKLLGDIIHKNYSFVEQEISKSKERKFNLDIE